MRGPRHRPGDGIRDGLVGQWFPDSRVDGRALWYVAIAAAQGRGQRVDGGTAGDVETGGVGLAAALPEPPRERLDATSPAGREHHVVPGLGELYRCSGPDPAACSGDDGCWLHG